MKPTTKATKRTPASSAVAGARSVRQLGRAAKASSARVLASAAARTADPELEARKLGSTGIGGPNTRPTTPSIQPPGALPGPTQQQGSDGVIGWGGYLVSGEKQPELTGQNLWRTYTNTLVTTTIIAAAVRYSINLLSGTNWIATPNPKAKDQALAKKCADLVRDGLLEADMPLPWTSHVGKAALYKWYGYSLHNWMWRKRDDGMLVYADLRHRPQYTVRRWNIETEGEPWDGVEQTTRQGGVYYLERQRLWYCADLTLTDSPTGVGLLRHVVEHARRLHVAEQLEGYGHTTNLRGIPVGRAPLKELYAAGKTAKGFKTPQDYVDSVTAEMRGLLTNHLKTPDQGLLLDSSVYKSNQSVGGVPSAVPEWALDVLKGDDAGLPAIFAMINRLNTEIARVMNVEHMLMTTQGSRAMHEDKTNMYAAFLNSTQMELAAFARNDLARPLVAANYGTNAANDCTPILTSDPISTEDITTVSTALFQLAQAGCPMQPNDPAYNQLRARMHLEAQPKVMLDLLSMPMDPTLPLGTKPGQPAPSGGTPADKPRTDQTGAGTGASDVNGLRANDAPAKRKRKAAA